MGKNSVTIDTNVLLDYPNVVDNYESIILPSAVLEELDYLKRNRELAAKARLATRKLAESTHILYAVKDIYEMPTDWDKTKLDNKIVMCAKENDCTLISNDLTVIAKAKSLDILHKTYTPEGYTGVEVLEGDTEEINLYFFAEGYKNLLENQYLIVRNTDTNEESEMVFRNGTLNGLKLPPSHVIKGLNAHQRCALDLLFNKDIPIKVVAGETGSGKTKLAVEVGYHLVVEENVYAKMTLVRNPIGSGEDVGFLPGDMDNKVGHFYAPIIENLGDTPEAGEEVVEDMIRREQLIKKIPFHMKGITIPNSFSIIDEAEDLDLKTLKLIGSRIGKNAVMVFSGDYDQAEAKFVNNNGLLRLIESTKGNPLVGIVVLDSDVRSSASKVFARLK